MNLGKRHYVRNLFPKAYEKHVKLWNAGWVKYKRHMGCDLTPVESARMSTLNPTGVDKAKDDNLRSFLWQHRHTSVFEQIEFVVEVQIPIFIARQVIRHRTFQVNEFSMRYSEPLHEYYIPVEDAIGLESDSNKQSTGQKAPPEITAMFIDDAKSDAILHKARYDKYRRHGVAKERVRDFQPVSAYTRVLLKANLRNWFHFLHLRLKPNAQLEIRELSEAIYGMIKDLFPLCAALFEEFTLNAHTFGASEMKVIRDVMKLTDDNVEALAKYHGLKGRRLKEFLEALS